MPRGTPQVCVAGPLRRDVCSAELRPFGAIAGNRFPINRSGRGSETVKRTLSLLVGGALAMAAGMAAQAAPSRVERAPVAAQGRGHHRGAARDARREARAGRAASCAPRRVAARHPGDRRAAALDAGEPLQAAAREAAHDGRAVGYDAAANAISRAKADVAREGLAKLGQTQHRARLLPDHALPLHRHPQRRRQDPEQRGALLRPRRYRRRLRRFGGVQPEGPRSATTRTTWRQSR